MNYRFSAFASLLLAVVSLVSCIDPDQSQEIIFQNDLKAIEEYLEDNTLPTAKEFSVPSDGIYMFWETSVAPTVNDQILRLDTVKVNYTGRLLTNKVFDSSIEQVAKDNGVYNSQRNYAPMRTALGVGLISGFEYATSLMRVGEKATVIFPSHLGYGSSGQNNIPPNSPLIFEIELLEVTNGPNHQ
ncbi:FKBP-type peptidyl-prolyl cis-trans isomerase [Algoriphagus sp. H41]|uniref:Peptidyl-prolyl cis-trans isomerase n=1 Tax=Algoriphagus oliviformis TaxID=2811231 RepID=A0ABS3BXK5_9BACT|nr:FKBP-type peptidyl-prolyl cis-trans isomerase [Algoriphagus oliviformis]MBN7809602.1 FKBP-type peptidyl-prolyl cis-trans isomerase [Algoriphagus oliviformis]